MNDGGVFHTTLQKLKTVGKHREVLERLAEELASIQQLEVEGTRVCKASSVAT